MTTSFLKKDPNTPKVQKIAAFFLSNERCKTFGNFRGNPLCQATRNKQAVTNYARKQWGKKTTQTQVIVLLPKQRVGKRINSMTSAIDWIKSLAWTITRVRRVTNARVAEEDFSLCC